METPKGNKRTKGNSGTSTGKESGKQTTNVPDTNEHTNEHTVVLGYAPENGSTDKVEKESIGKVENESTNTVPDLGDELRKVAAKYAESDYRHWVPMIIADRVGKIEELLQELVPDNTILDSIVEFGRSTDWKSDKKEILRKAASTVGVASLHVIAGAIANKMKNREEEED